MRTMTAKAKFMAALGLLCAFAAVWLLLRVQNSDFVAEPLAIWSVMSFGSFAREMKRARAESDEFKR